MELVCFTAGASGKRQNHRSEGDDLVLHMMASVCNMMKNIFNNDRGFQSGSIHTGSVHSVYQQEVSVGRQSEKDFECA